MGTGRVHHICEIIESWDKMEAPMGSLNGILISFVWKVDANQLNPAATCVPFQLKLCSKDGPSQNILSEAALVLLYMFHRNRVTRAGDRPAETKPIEAA